MRKNISLHGEIDRRAEAVIAKRGFSGLSDMIAVLTREEFERQGLSLPPARKGAPSPASGTNVRNAISPAVQRLAADAARELTARPGRGPRRARLGAAPPVQKTNG